MEFMPNGNLLQYVQRNAATLTVDDRLSLCADIINGLCYLHGKRPAPIIHRDLKVRCSLSPYVYDYLSAACTDLFHSMYHMHLARSL